MKKYLSIILFVALSILVGGGLFKFAKTTNNNQKASVISGEVLGVTTVTLQEGLDSYVGTEDKGIHSSFTANDQSLSVGGPTAWPFAIRFDLSGIQTDAVISSAKLSLYAYQDYPNEAGSHNKPLSLYKLLKPWVESQANTTSYATGLPWAVSYGRGADTDRVSTASASLTWKTGEFGWKDFDVTADVQSFVNGSSQNNGWSADLGTTYDVYFYSSENSANPTLRPKLTITYSSNSPLPPQPTADTKAPAISGVNSGSITSSGATITWATDEEADTQVEYGITTTYGKSSALKDTTTKVTNHSVAITGLASDTQYNYVVKSKDAAGNLSISANMTFTTLVAATSTPTTPPTTSTGVPGEPTPVPSIPTDPAIFKLSGSPIGQIALDGGTYSVKDHPRVWFDGPNGILTSKIKDPDGTGPLKGSKVDANFPPYQALRSRLDVEIIGCDTVSVCDGAYPSTDRNEVYAAMAALDWFMDNSRTKSKNYAIWKLNNIEKKIASRYQLGCIENYDSCELNSFADWPAETMVYTALAYTIMRPEMTPTERNIFAQKILNGYGDNDKCINQNVRTAAVVNYPGSGYKVTGSGFASAGLVPGDLIAIYDTNSAAPSYGYLQSVDSDTELTVSPQESNLKGVFVPFTSGLGGTNTQSVSNGALQRLTPQWLPGMCGQFWQIMHHGYQPPTVVRRDVTTALAVKFGANDTKITVQDASVFSGISKPFLVTTIRDIMRVTAINGNELTVERGACDTTPLAIASANSSVTYLKYPCSAVSTNLMHNLVIQKLQGYLTLSLALLDDDTRARLAFQRSIVDLKQAVTNSKEIWTGFLQGGSSDYYGRWSINVPSMVASTKQSLSGSPSLDFWGGNWLKDLVYYRLYISTPGKNKQNVPWGEARDIVNKFRIHGGLIAMMQYFYPNSPESRYGQFYGEDYTGLYTASGISSVPSLILWETIFSSQDDPKSDFTAELPTQRAFNRTDSVNPDGLSRAYNGWISRTGFNDPKDTQIFTTALSTKATDHGISGTGHAGSYKVYKNGWIISENGGAWSGVGLGANVLQFGTAINMITAPNFQSPLIDRAGGDNAPNSAWGYERTNLSNNVYTSAAAVSKALRNIVHFKKPNTSDYIVVFDEMSSVSPIQKGIRLHLDKTQGQTMTKSVLPDLEWKGNDRMLSTKVLLPVPGKVVKTEEAATYTINNYICASSDGNSCDTTNTSAEFLLVHKPSASTVDVMPAVILTMNSADWSCGQIEDSNSPKSFCFSKGGDKNSVAVTTTHAGTAQYLFTGLVAGNYIVKKDGVQIATQTVNWNDNSLYFESTKGVFQIAISGNPFPPPAPTVTISSPTISSFTALPSSITSGQSSTLSWSVTGADSLSINNGLGSVTGLASKVVSPSQSTTYTLSATNSSGVSTKSVTVNISTPVILPVISSISVQSTSTTTATITWNTDINTDTQVSYGITTSYGSNSPLKDSSVKVTSHSVVLTDLSPGTTYNFKVRSRDASGNLSESSNKTFTTTVDQTPPANVSVSNVRSRNVSNTSTIITWDTNIGATSQVFYSLVDTVGYKTPEADISGVTSHSVTLTGLVPCSKYRFKIRSYANGIESLSTVNTFGTSGCSGELTPINETTKEVLNASGDAVSLSNIKLTVPNEFTSNDSEFFQLQSFSKDQYSSQINPPSGKIYSNAPVYRATAYVSPTTTTSSFSKPIRVTFSYTDSDVQNINESTLKLYRYSNGVWTPLTDCSVDIAANTITCTSVGFSEIVLVGDQSTTTETTSSSPSSSGGGGGGGGSSSGGGNSSSGSSSGSSSSGSSSSVSTTQVNTTAITNINNNSNQVKATILINLSRGSKSEQVVTLQNLLIREGLLSSDSNTGYFGPLTETSVKSFQKKYGIVSSGSPSTTGYGAVGPKTRAKVNELLGGTTSVYVPQKQTTQNVSTSKSPTPTKLTKNLYNGITGGDVVALQNVLIKEGFLSPGLNTGYFGSLTEAAVKAFQKKYNIVISGTASTTGFGATGPKTRTKVNELGGY